MRFSSTTRFVGGALLLSVGLVGCSTGQPASRQAASPSPSVSATSPASKPAPQPAVQATPTHDPLPKKVKVAPTKAKPKPNKSSPSAKASESQWLKPKSKHWPACTPTWMKAKPKGYAEISASIEPYQTLTEVEGQLALSPPPGQVVWYSRTVKPGQLGNSLIIGHVSWGKPDVFWNLKYVPVGSVIQVGCESGQVLKLEVLQSYPVGKQDLLDGRIWDASDRAWVNFVTCNKDSPLDSTGHHHTQNYVVRTRPI